MGFRIQFTISDEEYEQLEIQAKDEGYPNVPALCKTRALQGENTYAELYKIMVDKIKSMKPGGAPFKLRDLIKTPPALLGRWLYENVQSGEIRDVEHIGNDGTDAEMYRKL